MPVREGPSSSLRRVVNEVRKEFCNRRIAGKVSLKVQGLDAYLFGWPRLEANQSQEGSGERASSCSVTSVSPSDTTNQSRDASRETSEVTTVPSALTYSQPNFDSSRSTIQSKMIRADKLLVENQIAERDKLRRIRKTRQDIGRKATHRFNNTIVLAPFHALKLCFQNKLKDLYAKETMENNQKRVKVPNNSIFQYDILELRTGSGVKGIAERGGSYEGRKYARRKKSDTDSQSEYCHCSRNEKKQSDSQSADLGKRKLREDEAGPSTQKRFSSPTLPSPKKRRIQPEEETQPVPRPIMCFSACNNSEKHTYFRKNSIKTTRTISSQTIEFQRDKTIPEMDRNPQEYDARTGVKKILRASAENDSINITRPATKTEKNNKTDAPAEDKTSPEVTSEISVKEVNVEEATGSAISLKNSDVSIEVLAEIISPNRVTIKDDKKDFKSGTSLETKNSDHLDNNQPTAVESSSTIVEVTKLFHTLLNEEKTGKQIRGVHEEFRMEEGKGEPLVELDKCLEPNVTVQETPNESSSSDRMTEDMQKIGDGPSISTVNGRQDLNCEKTSSYVFGPRNPFQQIRESCEFGFGMSPVITDDEDDCDGKRN